MYAIKSALRVPHGAKTSITDGTELRLQFVLSSVGNTVLPQSFHYIRCFNNCLKGIFQAFFPVFNALYYMQHHNCVYSIFSME